ncbi:MAG TPA: tetratricopeptide repeat protein [Kaistella sp.]|nr:tetratricopeptide repeat protein [Flavobacteriales bacterium]MCA0392158.1 tetratricopeptide repeat protein [Bacteroidota bacterium]HOB23770.1 tetratricopeptide repeat protein [Kaistella sp.]HPZ25794.1 tetratricopeptide repeat protein [Kaistella sp.]HQD44974.1 tetratricopeptide repeat protein [Kaistella sp.]
MNTNAIFSAVLMIFGLMFFSAQENYNTLIFKGNQQFDKKNYDNASSKYMEAAKLNEKDFTAHYNLGNALYKRKMYDEAKAEFEKAENLATTIPDKSAALYNSGNAYMQKNDSKKAAELYKQALKQDPYNETIRKNYEIAMRKEKEKQQQQQQKNNSDGGAGDNKNKDQNQGEDKGNTPKQEQGNGQQNKGEGEGNDPDQSKNNDADKMPKDLENSILNRVENKERETAKRILNKNSYSMPQSNEKDW